MTNPLYEPLNEAEQEAFASLFDQILEDFEEQKERYGRDTEIYLPSGSDGDDLAREIARHKEAGQTPDPDKVTHTPSAIDVLAYMRARLGVR